jgi:hypothetical protein
MGRKGESFFGAWALGLLSLLITIAIQTMNDLTIVVGNALDGSLRSGDIE